MRRREFLIFLGGSAALWPVPPRAQHAKLPIIGFLSTNRLEGQEKPIAAFHRGLGEVGYVDGRNVAIEYQVAEDRVDQLSLLAADLVRRQVAVIATATSVPAALAAKAATQSTQVVFFMGGDPVENGVVASLSRPGGNVTGVTTLAGDLFEKRLGLLHELVPAAGVIGYFANPTNPSFAKFAARVPIAARAIGIEVLELNATNAGEIVGAFTTLVQRRQAALLVSPDPLFVSQREQLVALAAQHAIPTSYFRREFVEIGGLLSYAADYMDIYRQFGVYVGRILNGQKPSELPVVQPTKFELVINLKTVKTLGITVPPSLLARADEVIE
jgi:putative tryptophan/tyrosine transport system substrate-binding protein